MHNSFKVCLMLNICIYFFIAASLSMEEAYASLKEKFDQAESTIADLKAKIDVVKSVCLFVIFYLASK